MAGPNLPRYGTPNWEMLGRWLELPAEQDGPFWAVNLMRYRPLAEYADGRATTLTGREADDTYVPFGPLAEIGAMVAFGADIAAQPAGEPQFHRIGIVRYPSRAAFFEMQRREDFIDLHAHKDAGMDFTIVLSSQLAVGEDPAADGELLLRVMRLAEGASAPPPAARCLAAFTVEGVIIGDERRWDEARLEQGPPGSDVQLAAGDGVEEQIVAVIGAVELDELSSSALKAGVSG